MPRTRSAIKALRVSERRRLRNRSVRSALRTYVRKARASLAAGPAADAPSLVRLAVSQLDKAATKGVIHRNQAARRKSRLMRRLAAAAQERAEAATAAPAPAGRAATAGRTGAGARSAASASPRTSRGGVRRSPAETQGDVPSAKPRATRTRRSSASG